MRPADLPTNIDAEIEGYVEVMVSSSRVEMTVRSYAPSDGNCVRPTQPPPKCTLAQV